MVLAWVASVVFIVFDISHRWVFGVFFLLYLLKCNYALKTKKHGLVIDTLTREITLSKESKTKQKKCTASWWNKSFLFLTVISIKNQRTLIFFLCKSSDFTQIYDCKNTHWGTTSYLRYSFLISRAFLCW